MKKHIFLFSILLITISTSIADPAPFGLEITKTKLETVKSKYSGKIVGINRFTNGKMYSININELEISGLKDVIAIFDKDDVLQAVLTKFDKYKYYDLLDSLNQKYNLTSQNKAFVGDKEAKFEDENTIIELTAPHMSFVLYLNYTSKNFDKIYKKTLASDEEAKKKNELEKL